jgi:hypothetical protein
MSLTSESCNGRSHDRNLTDAATHATTISYALLRATYRKYDASTSGMCTSAEHATSKYASSKYSPGKCASSKYTQGKYASSKYTTTSMDACGATARAYCHHAWTRCADPEWSNFSTGARHNERGECPLLRSESAVVERNHSFHIPRNFLRFSTRMALFFLV